MAVGFGAINSQKKNSTYRITKEDGTVVVECSTKEEAEQKKQQLSQSMNETLIVKEHRLI